MEEWYNAIKCAESIDKIEEIRIAIFGKKGIMNAEFARMKDLPDNEKGNFAKELNVHKEALNAFKAIGCSSWGRVDFMMDKDGNHYFIEVNTSPGMTSHSLVPMAAKELGINFDELVLEILKTADVK